MRLSTEIDILGRQGLNRSHTKVVRSSASLDSSSLSGGHARVAAWGSTLAMPHARVCLGGSRIATHPPRDRTRLQAHVPASEPTSGIVIFGEILGIFSRYANPSTCLACFRLCLLSYACTAGNFGFALYSYVISVFPCDSQPKPFFLKAFQSRAWLHSSVFRSVLRACPSERKPQPLQPAMNDEA